MTNAIIEISTLRDNFYQHAFQLLKLGRPVGTIRANTSKRLKRTFTIWSMFARLPKVSARNLIILRIEEK